MIHALSTDVHRSAFWRFANGTVFDYKQRRYRKTSAISALYLDKLHGPTIQYFNPFQQFTYVGPRTREFEGTVIDDDAMAVILSEDTLSPVEYDRAREGYLDKLREEVEMENHLLARPNFSSAPALSRSICVSKFALVFDVLTLPCRTVLNVYRAGVPAAIRSLRVYPQWFERCWKVARWDFWNGNEAPKPFIHVPVKPMVNTLRRYRWDKDSNQYKEIL